MWRSQERKTHSGWLFARLYPKDCQIGSSSFFQWIICDVPCTTLIQTCWPAVGKVETHSGPSNNILNIHLGISGLEALDLFWSFGECWVMEYKTCWMMEIASKEYVGDSIFNSWHVEKRETSRKIYVVWKFEDDIPTMSIGSFSKWTLTVVGEGRGEPSNHQTFQGAKLFVANETYSWEEGKARCEGHLSQDLVPVNCQPANRDTDSIPFFLQMYQWMFFQPAVAGSESSYPVLFSCLLNLELFHWIMKNRHSCEQHVNL